MEPQYKNLREDQDLTQENIADLLGVKKDTYKQWENQVNDISLEICNKLAVFYNVSIDYLLGLTKTKQYTNCNSTIDYNILRQRLKELRKKNRLTQTKLGDKVGFKKTTYASYENGKNIPKAFRLAIIADFYNCSVDYLLGKINTSMIKEETTPSKTMVEVSHARFKELRKINNTTQANLANSLGVKQTTYAKWESFINDIPLDTANALANYYNVSLDYLLGLTEIKQYDKYNLDINYKIMCTRLKQLRKECNLKQTELCLKLKMPQTTYSDLEHGKNIPTTFKLLNIISFYHVSMDYILGRIDTNNLNNP